MLAASSASCIQRGGRREQLELLQEFPAPLVRSSSQAGDTAAVAAGVLGLRLPGWPAVQADTEHRVLEG